MSGGIAYVLDPDSVFADKCNMGMVELGPVEGEDADELRGYIEKHVAATESTVASDLLLGRGRSEAMAHGMGAGDDALSAYFASTNDIERDDTPLVTFSHYSPRFECVPEKRFLLEPCLAKVSGSDHLGDLVLKLRPDVHVFGHTHIPIDIELDGTYHVQWPPLGSPREQSRQCAKALGPLELYSTATGAQWLGQNGAPDRTAWGQGYYSDKPRTPSVTEPAPWVASCRKRRAKKVREPRVPNHAGYMMKKK